MHDGLVRDHPRLGRRPLDRQAAAYVSEFTNQPYSVERLRKRGGRHGARLEIVAQTDAEWLREIRRANPARRTTRQVVRNDNYHLRIEADPDLEEALAAAVFGFYKRQGDAVIRHEWERGMKASDALAARYEKTQVSRPERPR